MVKAADPNGIPLPVTVEDGFYDEEFPHSQESLGRDTKCEWPASNAMMERPVRILMTT